MWALAICHDTGRDMDYLKNHGGNAFSSCSLVEGTDNTKPENRWVLVLQLGLMVIKP
jgi:hypothetical protein